MKLKIAIVSALLATLMFASPSKAWNCPSGQIRQQAPAGTPTTAPNYDVVEGIAFICVPSVPSTTPTGSLSQTQNQSQTATSSSAATSSATNTTSTNVKNTATGTGGSISNSGNSSSSVKNSGNSTNSLSNTLSLQNSGNSSSKSSSSLTNSGNSAQSQSSSSSASNNGNGANNSNYQSNTDVHAAAATAFASALPTAPCVIGYGAGGQTLLGGLSFSSGKVDKNCAVLETARSFANFGSDVAYCKTMLTDKYAKAAGVTMEDCLARHQVIVPTPIPTPIIEHQPPQIIVNVPQPVAQAQAELPVKEQTTEIRELPSCNVYSGVTNVCKRIVDDAIIALNENPETQLILRGPQQGAAVVQYLRSRGVSASRVQMFFGDDQNWTLNFELFTVSK